MKNYTIQDLIDFEYLPIAKNDLLKAVIKARLNNDYRWYKLYDLFVTDIYITNYSKLDEYEKIDLLDEYDIEIDNLVYELLEKYCNMDKIDVYNNFLKSINKNK